MKRLLFITTCLLSAAPALAQTAAMQSPAYQECTGLATTNPSLALAKADAWLRIDIGIAAQHCRAMALYGLHRYAEAAEALTTIRTSVAPGDITLRTYLTRQATQAYIGASMPDKALAQLGAQITEIGTIKDDNATGARLTSDLLLDRARLNVTYGKLPEAAKDLDHAVSLTPVNEDVLLQRASVFEKLGDVPLARNDVDAVLIINSANAQARQMRDRLNAPRPVVTVAPAAVPVAPIAAPAPAAPATSNPANPHDTSTLLAPTPMLPSSTSATPPEGGATTATPSAPVTHKKRKPAHAASQPTVDSQAP